MKRDCPPVVATLLLRRLGPSGDGLIGDLAEEWQAGRSALWYWRQVWSVIATTTIRGSRVALSALLLVAASVFAEPLIVSLPPYSMRIVDAGTGEGVPGLRITTDDGIVCYTLLDGTVTWGESSLMGRAVRFEIQDETHRFDSMGTTLDVTRGGRSKITVRRATPHHTP